LDRRRQLAAALTEARKRKCAVVVAKLDRLSRDVHFISGLMAHKVPFIMQINVRGKRREKLFADASRSTETARSAS
jgi:DNA invertase Pin-like site-specific DNA recombinase